MYTLVGFISQALSVFISDTVVTAVILNTTFIRACPHLPRQSPQRSAQASVRQGWAIILNEMYEKYLKNLVLRKYPYTSNGYQNTDN